MLIAINSIFNQRLFKVYFGSAFLEWDTETLHLRRLIASFDMDFTQYDNFMYFIDCGVMFEDYTMKPKGYSQTLLGGSMKSVRTSKGFTLTFNNSRCFSYDICETSDDLQFICYTLQSGKEDLIFKLKRSQKYKSHYLDMPYIILLGDTILVRVHLRFWSELYNVNIFTMSFLFDTQFNLLNASCDCKDAILVAVRYRSEELEAKLRIGGWV